MKTYLLFLIGIFLIGAWFFQHKCSCNTHNALEGFADKTPQSNMVSTHISRILSKTTSLLGALANPRTWTDRIALRGKTPVEMARAYLNSNRKL